MICQIIFLHNAQQHVFYKNKKVYQITFLPPLKKKNYLHNIIIKQIAQNACFTGYFQKLTFK